MTTIHDINWGRRQRNQTEIRDAPTVHFLEDAIKSFEKSPKKLGNRDHFRMLLALHLSPDHASEIAYDGVDLSFRK